MQRTDIGSSLGNGSQYIKYTVAYTDLTAAATSQTLYPSTNPGGNSFQSPSTTAPPNALNLQVPQTGFIKYVKVHHTVAFAGGGATSVTVSVGKLGGSNTFATPAWNVFQAVSDTTLQETVAIPSAQLSAWGLTFNFVSIGGNLSALTAGSVDIYINFQNISSPSE